MRRYEVEDESVLEERERGGNNIVDYKYMAFNFFTLPSTSNI